MPQLKDVIKVLSEQIKSDELTAALSATDENVELTEEGFEDLTKQIKGLMTFDAAINNETILNAQIDKINKGIDSPVHKELKNKILYQAEKKVAEFGQNIGLDLNGKKIDEQIEALNSHATTLKSGNQVSEDAKKQIEDLNKQLKDATEQNKNIESKFNNDRDWETPNYRF